MFRTTEYDIQFGFYYANEKSYFEVLNEGDELKESIVHPVA